VGSGAYTIDELTEIALQLAIFLGWPRAQRVMTVVETVRAEMVGRASDCA
jgi:alkylhydroperoxidase/carboxymuconolactone decarboxylase family protein YurZ